MPCSGHTSRPRSTRPHGPNGLTPGGYVEVRRFLRMWLGKSLHVNHHPDDSTDEALRRGCPTHVPSSIQASCWLAEGNTATAIAGADHSASHHVQVMLVHHGTAQQLQQQMQQQQRCASHMRGRTVSAAGAFGRVQWKPPKNVGHKKANPSRMSRDARHASPACSAWM